METKKKQQKKTWKLNLFQSGTSKNLLKMYKSKGGGRQTNRTRSRQTGKEGKGGEEIIEEKITNSRVRKSRKTT